MKVAVIRAWFWSAFVLFLYKIMLIQSQIGLPVVVLTAVGVAVSWKNLDDRIFNRSASADEFAERTLRWAIPLFSVVCMGAWFGANSLLGETLTKGVLYFIPLVLYNLPALGMLSMVMLIKRNGQPLMFWGLPLFILYALMVGLWMVFLTNPGNFIRG